MVKRIAGAFSAPGVLEAYPGVDGVIAITHSTGCGMAADGEGLAQLRRTLSGYARHPNVGAVVLVGLGCEVNQISALTEDLGLIDPLVIQELGGSAATVRRGVEQVRELLPPSVVSVRRCRSRRSPWVSTAAAPTPGPESAPTRCSAWRSIAWSPPAAPRCWPRRLRSTGLSTC